jgi:hypothetical protein
VGDEVRSNAVRIDVARSFVRHADSACRMSERRFGVRYRRVFMDPLRARALLVELTCSDPDDVSP